MGANVTFPNDAVRLKGAGAGGQELGESCDAWSAPLLIPYDAARGVV